MPIRAGYEQVASLGAGELGTCRQGREAEAGPWFKWVPRPGNEHMQTLRFPHNGQNETLKMNRAGLSPCLTSSSGLPSLTRVGKDSGASLSLFDSFPVTPPLWLERHVSPALLLWMSPLAGIFSPGSICTPGQSSRELRGLRRAHAGAGLPQGSELHTLRTSEDRAALRMTPCEGSRRSQKTPGCTWQVWSRWGRPGAETREEMLAILQVILQVAGFSA